MFTYGEIMEQDDTIAERSRKNNSEGANAEIRSFNY